MGQALIGLQQIVQCGPLEIPASLESRIYEILASLHYYLCPLVMLHLYTSSQIQILDERSRSNYDLRQGFCGDVLVEFGRIEACPKLSIKTHLVKIPAHNRGSYQFLRLQV